MAKMKMAAWRNGGGISGESESIIGVMAKYQLWERNGESETAKRRKAKSGSHRQ
jgi:hypothetical protein